MDSGFRIFVVKSSDRPALGRHKMKLPIAFHQSAGIRLLRPHRALKCRLCEGVYPLAWPTLTHHLDKSGIGTCLARDFQKHRHVPRSCKTLTTIFSNRTRLGQAFPNGLFRARH